MDILTNINVIFYIIAYFIGAIPFGLVVVKLLYGIDIRKVGSGSIGATNVYRALKEHAPKNAKILSIFTILLDATKGLLVVLAAKIYGLDYSVQWLIAVLAVLGHCYSPYLGFRGGKGVATTIGSVFLLIPIEGCFGLLVWALVGKVFKVSSLSSMLGVLCGILFAFVTQFFDLPEAISIVKQINSHAPLYLLGALILYTHIPNIKRLLTGQEGKVL